MAVDVVEVVVVGEDEDVDVVKNKKSVSSSLRTMVKLQIMKI